MFFNHLDPDYRFKNLQILHTKCLKLRRHIHVKMVKRGLIVSFLITLLSFHAFSQEAVLSDSYQIKQWTTKDGLPQNSVNEIMLSSDGYLWIGTYGGLCKFDGLRFKRINHPDLKYERVISLLEDSNGNIWVGSENNGLYQLRGKEVIHYTIRDGLPGLGITDLFETSDQHIGIVVQGRGIAFMVNDSIHFKQHRVFYDSNLDQAITENNGQIWLSTSNGLYSLKTWQSDPMFIEGSKSNLDATAITKNDEEKIFLANQGGVYLLDKDKMRVNLLFKHNINLAFRQLLIDSKGLIWLGSNKKGVISYNQQGQEMLRNFEELPTGEVSCLYEDEQGAIWLGINGGGLMKIGFNPVSNLDADDGLKDEAILAIHKDNKRNLWIGTNSGSFYKMELNTGWIKEYETEKYGIDSEVWSIATDEKENIWVGTFGDGIYKWDQESKKGFEPIKNSGAQSDVILAMHYDTLAQRLLIGTDRGGVFQFKDKQWSTLIPESLTKARVTQIVLHPYSENTICIATQGDGVKIINSDGSVNSIDESNGLPFNSIRAILFDHEGLMWLGSYGKGLFVQMNNEFKVINSAQGLFDDLVSTINLDQQGFLWMSCNNGVFRVKRESLLSLAKGEINSVQSQVFNTSHGMGDSETNGGFQPSSVCLENGTILYPTMKGVAFFDSQSLQEEPPIKYLHIERLEYGDTLLESPDKFIIPKEHRDITFHYSAPSFHAPELIKFEYFLEGYDTKWKSSGTNRFVNYTRLAPGNYTFKLRARNSHGTLSDVEANVNFQVESYLYETTLFKGLSVGTILFLILFYFKRKQDQARKRELILEREVKEKTKHLNEEKQMTERALEKVAQKSTELEKVNRAKSVFFSNVSHELKTPLTLIKGPLENLLDSNRNQLDQEALRDLQLAHNNANQLNRLITQLLEIARSEEGKLEVNHLVIDVKQLLEQLFTAYEGWIQQKELNFTWKAEGESFVGISDPDLLEKVVSNLLSNAFKFTPAGGEVHLEINVTEEQLSISVADSGIGIAEKELPHIFDRFHKVEGQEEVNSNGSGIGLALVKEFVELLGGKIKVENKQDQGASFSFSIPFPSSEEEPTVLEESQIKESGQMIDTEAIQSTDYEEEWPLVLVVDDHADIRMLIKQALKNNYRIIEAENGEEGFQKAKEYIPDLIISDIMMPKVDGMAFLNLLKSDASTDFIATLLLTARGSEDIRVEGWKKGAEAYMAKPFNIKELQYRVEGILNNRKKLRSKMLLDFEKVETQDDLDKTDFQRQFETLVYQKIPEPDFSFTDVLTDFGMSRSSFQRAVNKEYNCSPIVYLKKQRLTLAKALLKKNEGTIAEVAYACGFNSVSYFNRAFKQQFKATPTSILSSSESG